MKVCIEQFLGENHSWAVCGQNLARTFHSLGHEVHLRSTNGYAYFPEDLKSLVKPKLDNDYDCQISYTAMRNFPNYLSHGNKNRFGIWNYEFTVLPFGFSKYANFCDLMLPSSNFSKKIFLENGIPEDKLVMIRHGFDTISYSGTSKYELQTKKKVKILANIAQPHIRKNLGGLLEAYGRAFSKKDDVCLVLKVVDKPPKALFEVSFSDIFKAFKRKFPNAGECEVITQFIPDISSLYRACDITFTMTHAECFFFPGLEALASGNIVIAPRYGGQLDFLSDNNAVLIDGKVVPAPKNAQYWSASPYSAMFEPSIEDAVVKLRDTVYNLSDVKGTLLNNVDETLKNYTWESVVQDIIKLCKDV